SNLGEGAGVGRRVGAGGAADRRLVDVDHLVELLEARDFLARAADDACAVQGAGGAGVERVDGERGLAAAAYAGHAGERAQGKLYGHTLKVVCGSAVDGDMLARSLATGLVERDLASAGEIVRGDAGLAGEELGQRTLADHLAAVNTGARAHVDDVIGMADRVLVMFDHEDGVAQ